MRDGFVKVAAVTPEVRVADVAFNVESCVAAARQAAEKDGAVVIVLPELALSGYTCEDLFWQDALIRAADAGLADFAAATADLDALLLVGVPVRAGGKLYNCAAVVSRGMVLGLVPKTHIPTYNEFYEGRHFVSGPVDPVAVSIAGEKNVPMGTSLLFSCLELPELVVAAEICEDLWVAAPPSIAHAQAGATLICNLSASNAVVGKADYRRSLVTGQSARLLCGYVYASAGTGESTQDLVFSGHDLVAENGRLLAEGRPFGDGHAVSEIDVRFLAAERTRMSTFECATAAEEMGYVSVPFSLGADAASRETRLCHPGPWPRQAPLAHALAPRGDRPLGRLGLHARPARDRARLRPAGTSARRRHRGDHARLRHHDACELARTVGAELREIGIAASVRQHFADIGHDESVHDVTYENAQARERTQILMDVANQEGGLVIGTGDLSELALGWATYNGDHMSMYAVNASVPKTLVRHLVRYVADTCGNAAESEVLLDVLDTPVSPELLPATGDGKIAQKTEDLVGPYELHDFFLYEVLRRGTNPAKVYRLARYALGEKYDDATILSWLKVFYRRYFAQQFKRSCLPDGPKVGSAAVSPRGDLRMPSDACSALWLAELETL